MELFFDFGYDSKDLFMIGIGLENDFDGYNIIEISLFGCYIVFGYFGDDE